MNFAKHLISFAAITTFATTACAQPAIHGSGVVKTVDAAAGVVNLAHEPIESLKWPAMVMDFKVKDKAQLSKLTSGQKVAFTLTKNSSGGYDIKQINVVK